LEDADIMYEVEMDPPEKIMPPMDLPIDTPIVEMVSNVCTRLTGKKVKSIGLADSTMAENGPVCRSPRSCMPPLLWMHAVLRNSRALAGVRAGAPIGCPAPHCARRRYNQQAA